MSVFAEAARSHLARVEGVEQPTILCRAIVDDLRLHPAEHALARLAWNLSRITSHSHRRLVSDALSVDDAIAGSVLVREAGSALAEATADRWRSSQWWLPAERSEPPRVERVPRRESLRLPRPGVEPVKPATAGLFTSTSTASSLGMWHIRLALAGPAAQLSLPAVAYRLTPVPTARVAVVDSAAAWVRLVEDHALERGATLVPDWAQIANGYDAVHLTCRGVASIQGVVFATNGREIPASYWDVECTVWLAWVFDEFESRDLAYPRLPELF